MPGPELGVKLYADTAEFQADLGKAAHTAEQQARRIELATVAIGTAIGDALVRAAVAFKNGIEKAIEYRARLDDLADTTGESVKNLDGLARSAQISGVSFDRVESAVIRLSRTLNEAGDESKKSAKALEAIGLSAEAVKAMKPAEAMQEIARALAKFEDGAGKVAVAQAIMGKEGAKLLPLFKDLAAEGLQQGKITAEQAAAAERLQFEWRRLSVEGGELGRTIANSVIPWAADMIEQFRKGKEIFGGFWAAAFGAGMTMPGDPGEKLNVLRREMDALQRLREQRAGEPGSKAEIDQMEADLRKKIEWFKFLQRQQANAQIRPENNDARDLAANAKPTLAFDPRTDKEPGAARPRKERDFEFEAFKKEQQIAEEAAAATQKFYQGLGRENAQLAADTQKMWKQVFETIDREQADAIAEGAEMLRVVDEEAKRLDDTARQLGLTITSSFEDAMVGGKGLSAVFRGLEMDIARLIVRKTMTEPLAAAGTDFIKDILRGTSLFGGARAEGGPVSMGSAYLVGERGPEMFVPSVPGNIVPNAGPGRADVLNITFNVNTLDGRTAAAVIMQNKEVIKGVIRQANAESGRRTAF